MSGEIAGLPQRLRMGRGDNRSMTQVVARRSLGSPCIRGDAHGTY